MKRWALIEDNIVGTVVEQETKPLIEGNWVECELGFGPGWRYIDNSFMPPIPNPVILNKLQVIELLANDYNTIVSTSKTDVDVEVWLERFRLTELFNLSDNKVINDIQFLVTKNLINQQKANLILTQK
jgi:hypothetical protein